jgi:hypothetical protein
MEGLTFHVGMLVVGGVVGLSMGVIALYIRRIGTEMPKQMQEMKQTFSAQIEKIEGASKERLGEFKVACGAMRAECQADCQRQLDERREDAQDFHREFHEIILAFPEKYTLREDHVRWSIQIEGLVRDIHTEILKTKGQGVSA